MPAKNPIKLADIAERVGINRSEVSRVLSGISREGRIVSSATREHILEVARELKYYPNRVAQSLANGHTNAIGLMMAMTGEHSSTGYLPEHYQEIIGALTYTLHEYGIHLLLAQCTPKHGGEHAAEKMEHIMRSQLCDGMVISDITVDDERPSVLQKIGLPFVIIGSPPEFADVGAESGPVAVDIDNASVGYEGVSYLYGQGHRHIAVYNVGRDLMSGRHRLRGITQASKEHGIGCRLEYNDDAHFQMGVYSAVTQRLNEPAFPTAIFTQDETSAFGAERALREAGLRVPEDVSIITCMNTRLMHLVAPRLTAINLRQGEVASFAARLLANQLRGIRIERRSKLFPPVIEPAKTTGPPRKHRFLVR